MGCKWHPGHTVWTVAALNLKRRIDENRPLVEVPSAIKRVFRDGDFLIVMGGGAYSRNDYHVDPGQEFFYQVEGDMVLKIMQDWRPIGVPVRAGEMLLLPANVRHSPQCFANSVDLIIERLRRPSEQDGSKCWENGGHLLYEEFFELKEIENQFSTLFERRHDLGVLRWGGRVDNKAYC